MRWKSPYLRRFVYLIFLFTLRYFRCIQSKFWTWQKHTMIQLQWLTCFVFICANFPSIQCFLTPYLYDEWWTQFTTKDYWSEQDKLLDLNREGIFEEIHLHMTIIEYIPFTVLKSNLSLNSGLCCIRDILLFLSGETSPDPKLSLYNFGDWEGSRNVLGVGAELVKSRPVDDTLIGLSSLLEVDFIPSYLPLTNNVGE